MTDEQRVSGSMEFDPATYPRLAAYLEPLPRGLDSHPQCRSKASVLGSFVDFADPPLPEAGLPEPLYALLHAPPPVSTWIPTVHVEACMAVLCDVLFPGPGGTQRFINRLEDHDRALLRGPLYRALFTLLSPERLLAGAQRRWGAFYQGTELRVLERGKHRTVLRLEHPEHLFDAAARRGFGRTFAVLADLAGGKDVHSVPVLSHPTRTDYSLTWTR